MQMNRRQRRHPEISSSRSNETQPVLSHSEHEAQPYGAVVRMPIALDVKVCADIVQDLNQILADTMALRDLHKKHHWQAAGPTFYPLHLLFDKHFQEQSELVDEIAERIQCLAGSASPWRPMLPITRRFLGRPVIVKPCLCSFQDWQKPMRSLFERPETPPAPPRRREMMEQTIC